MNEPQALAQLEEVVDKFGLADTLTMLADICSLKADHVRTNWQDEPLARTWENASVSLSWYRESTRIAELTMRVGGSNQRSSRS